MTPGRTGLCFLMMCVGCGGIPLAPPAQMWVATQPQGVELEAAQAECDLFAQVTSGSLETTLSVWVDEAEFMRCMEHDGWAMEPIEGVSPTSSVKTHVNVRSGPSSESQVMAQLSSGARANFLTEVGDWYRVRLNDGSEGFVSAQWTELVGAKQ
ncbi:MAG: SH3 domain-containing protein [Deltaproteobacteria bacterium]|nr:SH3 domain-containing protein [Deltaproteobacteria bacterium]